MDYDRFVSLVQNRARVTATTAANSVRATFETLAERIGAKEAHSLAAQLPKKIADYLQASWSEAGEQFSFDEFCQRVARREACEVAEAFFHARCVVEILKKAITGGELSHVTEVLPTDFMPLFATVPVERSR